MVDWGAKAVILMRFANSEEQGLILGNTPLIESLRTHTIEEFKNIVDEIHSEFGDYIRVTGTPLHDPVAGTPFALAKEENKSILDADILEIPALIKSKFFSQNSKKTDEYESSDEPKNKKEQIQIIILIFLLLFVAIYYFLIPFLNGIKTDFGKSIKSYEKNIDNLNLMISCSVKIVGNLEELGNELKSMKKHMII